MVFRIIYKFMNDNKEINIIADSRKGAIRNFRKEFVKSCKISAVVCLDIVR